MAVCGEQDITKFSGVQPSPGTNTSEQISTSVSGTSVKSDDASIASRVYIRVERRMLSLSASYRSARETFIFGTIILLYFGTSIGN